MKKKNFPPMMRFLSFYPPYWGSVLGVILLPPDRKFWVLSQGESFLPPLSDQKFHSTPPLFDQKFHFTPPKLQICRHAKENFAPPPRDQLLVHVCLELDPWFFLRSSIIIFNFINIIMINVAFLKIFGLDLVFEWKKVTAGSWSHNKCVHSALTIELKNVWCSDFRYLLHII